MTATLTAERRSLLTHHPIGASTGYMYAIRGDWRALIAEAIELSPFAAELSVLSESEMEGLACFLADRPALPFRYLSIHGPSKGRTMSEPYLVEALIELAPHAESVVMHPDTMSDPEQYRRLGHKLVIENMDAGKLDGCTVEQLRTWFADVPLAGFCFDIAHAWSIDPSMDLARELLDEFGSRLRHVHVSSLSGDLHHVPLTEEHEELFMPLLERCLDVPWILEAPPRSPQTSA
jgi:xylose isomerase-like TIM barrel protein